MPVVEPLAAAEPIPAAAPAVVGLAILPAVEPIAAASRLVAVLAGPGSMG